MAEDIAFEFDIVVALPKGFEDDDAIMDALFAGGCDDAVVGLGAPGLVGLGFTRAGEEAEIVISQTVMQVLSALPKGTQLREVKPDLVSLADVAARLSVSRQALQVSAATAPLARQIAASFGGVALITFTNATLSATGQLQNILNITDHSLPMKVYHGDCNF